MGFIPHNLNQHPLSLLSQDADPKHKQPVSKGDRHQSEHNSTHASGVHPEWTPATEQSTA